MPGGHHQPPFENNRTVFMAAMLEDPEAPAMLADAMAQSPDEADPEALQRLDEDRQAFMVPAWILYGPCLTRPELAALHPLMVGIIAAESMRASLDIWDDLWRLRPAEPARTLIQKALMQARTASLEGRPTAPAAADQTLAEPHTFPTRALFSDCDGQGSFTVLVESKLPNGHVNLHSFVMGQNAELRDGSTMANREPGALEELMATYLARESIPFAPVPLAVAHDWARAGLRHAANHPDATEEPIADARRAAAIMAWSLGMGQPDQDEPAMKAHDPRPAGTMPAPREQEILGVFLVTHLSWFLDRDQLEDLGVDTAALIHGDSDLVEATLTRINTPAVRAHLQNLMHHMSLYRLYAGPPLIGQPGAELYDYLAVLLDDPVEARRVLRPYLTNALAALLSVRPEGHGEIGDPLRRERLRALGFPRLGNPKGKHMAYLDFAEVAHQNLESISALKGDDYLAEEAFYHVALALAKAYVDAFFELGDGRLLPSDRKRFRRLLNAMQKHGGLDADRAQGLWDWMTDHFQDFEDSICIDCPVACLERPTGNLEVWFLSEKHPGFGGED